MNKTLHNISMTGKISIFLVLFLAGGIFVAMGAGFVSYEPADDTFILWDSLKIGTGGVQFGSSVLGDAIGDGNMYIEEHELFVGDSIGFCNSYTATSSVDSINCSSILGPQDQGVFLSTGRLENDNGIELVTDGSGGFRMQADIQDEVDVNGKVLGGGSVKVGGADSGNELSVSNIETDRILNQGDTPLILGNGGVAVIDADGFDVGSSFSRILLEL